MKTTIEQIDKQPEIIKLFSINYARDLYYSGKKKKHTVKNLYTANHIGLIIYKSKRRQIGKNHDYNIYKKNHLDVPQRM
jgi:hypothetical protein